MTTVNFVVMETKNRPGNLDNYMLWRKNREREGERFEILEREGKRGIEREGEKDQMKC